MVVSAPLVHFQLSLSLVSGVRLEIVSLDAPGDLQVKNARLGGVFNMGGTSVANYVSILERIK